MAHVAPRSMDEMPDLTPVFEGAKAAMGFVPNSMLTLGRRPEILQGFAALAGSVLAGGTIDPELESSPLASKQTLDRSGWQTGKHAR